MRLLGKLIKQTIVKWLLKKDHSPFLFLQPLGWGQNSHVITGVPVSMFARERTFRNESQR